MVLSGSDRLASCHGGLSGGGALVRFGWQGVLGCLDISVSAYFVLVIQLPQCQPVHPDEKVISKTEIVT